MMFCGFPKGVRDEPMLDESATTVTAFETSMSEILEMVKTSGTKTKTAESFIITAEDVAVINTRVQRSLNSEFPEKLTILLEMFVKAPESSRPLDIIKNEIMADRLS